MKNCLLHLAPLPASWLLTAGLTLSLLLGGCGKKIEGDLITRELSLAAVEGLDMAESGTVFLREGSPQKIEVRAPATLLNLLNTDVDNGQWKINFRRQVRFDADQLTIYVTAPALRVVEMSGSGNITSLTTLTAPSLRIGLSGSGNMELTANTTDVSTSISGSGNVRLNGRTTNQNVRLSGAGNYRAFELPSAEATATLSGSGNIEVRAANTLRADLSGSGDVRYRGQPRVSSTVTGSGRVVDSN